MKIIEFVSEDIKQLLSLYPCVEEARRKVEHFL